MQLNLIKVPGMFAPLPKAYEFRFSIMCFFWSWSLEGVMCNKMSRKRRSNSRPAGHEFDMLGLEGRQGRWESG